MYHYATARELITAALDKCGGNESDLARKVGVSATAVRSWRQTDRKPGFTPTMKMLRLVYGDDDD